tara:strand:+ start:3004 stop:4332 length:1329 start_codon:yes stop_codon:yes gene_type:complete
MKISIIGCGYVGIVTGVCLANSGHKIYFYDKDKKKLSDFKSGNNLIFEKNLDNRLNIARKKNNIFFCNTLEESIKESDATFICVGTPLKKKNIDLQYIKKITIQLSKLLQKKKYFSIIYKSTIPPFTVEKTCIPILKKRLGNKINQNINVIFNPEFLREGNAIYDFENPIRIIMGVRNNKSKSILRKIYKKYKNKSKFIFVDIKTAEFIKYYSNAFFSLLISYSNEISNLCYKVGIDYIDVFNSFKLDNRLNINNKNPELINYMIPGIGYGGSCFPKDVKTFIKFAENNNFNLSILKDVDKINSLQPKIISRIILNKFQEKKIKECLVLGLTFKENTDDIRNSTSLEVINLLAKSKIKIYVYDPIFSKKLFIKNKKLFNYKIKYIEKIDFNQKFNFIVVNNISREFKKILKYYNKRYKSLIFDSRRAFRNEKFKNYLGSSLN